MEGYSGMGEERSSKMEELENRFNEALEFLPGALIEFDISKMAVTYMNRMAIFLFGYERTEIEKGIPVQDIFINEDEFLRAKKVVEEYILENVEKKTPYTRYEKQELQKIIDENLDQANEGCSSARQAIINAQVELDDIANQEGGNVFELFAQNQRNLVEFSLTF